MRKSTVVGIGRRGGPDARDRSRPAVDHLAWTGMAAGALMLAGATGCTVITTGVAVVSTAAAVAVGAASAAIDVGVGAAKVTGKVIGKGVDAVTPAPSEPPKP